MSFTPSTYTTGTTVSGPDVRNNFKAADRSLHLLVVNNFSDGSIDKQAIVKPDFYFGSNSRWTSGQFYHVKTGSDKPDYQYVTSHIKQSYFTSKTASVDIVGGRLVLPLAADVLVFCTASVEGFKNVIASDTGASSEFHIALDGFEEAISLVYVGDLDGTTHVASPHRDGNLQVRHTPFSTFWYDNLTAGTYEIKLVADPVLEQTTINNVNFIIEVYYNV